MADYIDRHEAILTALDYEGHGNAQDACMDIADDLGCLPIADVVSRKEYDELLEAAQAMHEWIFLNTGDEYEVYHECGLSAKMNALLGGMGSFEIRAADTDEEDE